MLPTRVRSENIQSQVLAETHLRSQLTISLGIASLRGDQVDGQKLVGQADRALYQAKHLGRNRAVVYQDWMVEPTHRGS